MVEVIIAMENRSRYTDVKRVFRWHYNSKTSRSFRTGSQAKLEAVVGYFP